MSSPTTPIRKKKRNFKFLQLGVPLPLPGTNLEVPTLLAPVPIDSVPVGKKGPPPMVIKAPKILVSSDAVSAVEQDGTVSPSVGRNAEIKFHLKGEDLKDLQELGQGNGGNVKKVEHIPTGTIMARKVRLFPLFLVLTDNSNHKSILIFRLSSLMQSQQYGNKSYVNYT
jgi:mitogen-activated protein kinase kinase